MKLAAAANLGAIFCLLSCVLLKLRLIQDAKSRYQWAIVASPPG
jgi:hypothetical protein